MIISASNEINHPFFSRPWKLQRFLSTWVFLIILNHSQSIIFQFSKKGHKFGDFFKVLCYLPELISENLVYLYGPKIYQPISNINHKLFNFFIFCTLFFSSFFEKLFFLSENKESTPVFVNLIGINLVLGHKSWKSQNLFSDALHQTSTLNLKLCRSF